MQASNVLERAFREEFCPLHNDWKDVLEEWKRQWHSRCNQCTYSRSHGQAKVYAERAAKEHERRSGHRVSVGYYGNHPTGIEVLKMAETRQTPDWSLLPDLPPF